MFIKFDKKSILKIISAVLGIGIFFILFMPLIKLGSDDNVIISGFEYIKGKTIEEAYQGITSFCKNKYFIVPFILSFIVSILYFFDFKAYDLLKKIVTLFINVFNFVVCISVKDEFLIHNDISESYYNKGLGLNIILIVFLAILFINIFDFVLNYKDHKEVELFKGFTNKKVFTYGLEIIAFILLIISLFAPIVLIGVDGETIKISFIKLFKELEVSEDIFSTASFTSYIPSIVIYISAILCFAFIALDYFFNKKVFKVCSIVLISISLFDLVYFISDVINISSTTVLSNLTNLGIIIILSLILVFFIELIKYYKQYGHKEFINLVLLILGVVVLSTIYQSNIIGYYKSDYYDEPYGKQYTSFIELFKEPTFFSSKVYMRYYYAVVILEVIGLLTLIYPFKDKSLKELILFLLYALCFIAFIYSFFKGYKAVSSSSTIYVRPYQIGIVQLISIISISLVNFYRLYKKN